MSVTTKIRIVSDNATPALAKLMDEMQPATLAQKLRQPFETFWRMRLKDFPRLPGKFAAMPPTGFGESASRSVVGFARANGVTLEARQQGLLLRFQGGTIRPVNKKVLCFGITEESYGKTVYDFGYVPGQKDKALNEKLRTLFAFARQITFEPNPAIVPSADEFSEVAMGVLERTRN